MQIKDLKPRMNKVDIVVEVTDIGDIRDFSKFGRPGKVASATAKDETGTISLTLWNEQIDTVGVGDKVQIKNGYVGEWQGEMQLTTGRLGSIEVVGEKKKPKEKEKKAVTKEEPKEEKEEGKERKGKKEKEKREEKKGKEEGEGREERGKKGAEEEGEWIVPDEREEDFKEEDFNVDEEDVY